MEDRNVELSLQPLLDLKALGCSDVFKVDATEGGRDGLHRLDELIHVGLVDFDIKHVDVSELLEEVGLALHDGLAGECADVPEPKNRRSVGDDGHEVSFGRVVVGQLLVLVDVTARLGNTRRVGQRQVALTHEWLGRRDLNFSLPSSGMVLKGFFAVLTHCPPKGAQFVHVDPGRVKVNTAPEGAGSRTP